MSDVQLGSLISGEQHRDAIHIAVIPVTASKYLQPGKRVSIDRNGVAMPDDSGIGIVDPFLQYGPDKGEQFWLVLMPNTVTGMRHHWSHPAFDVVPDAPTKEESEAWLRKYISKADCPDYDTVIAAATGMRIDGVDGYGEAYHVCDEYLHFDGRDAHGQIPVEFWDHVENVTGRKCPERPQYWSCSC